MNALLRDLALNTAQDIRNPITSIKGLLQLTAEKTTIEENHYRVMIDELNRVSQMIDEFLLLTKNSRMNLLSCNINLLINGFMQMCQPLFDTQNIKILKNLTAQKITVVVDQEHIYYVILNIIKNSVNAMPAGGILAVITRPAGNMICIEFCHTGLDTGSGLRLSLTGQLLKNCNGSMQVKSQNGHGSTVRVYLPAN